MVDQHRNNRVSQKSRRKAGVDFSQFDRRKIAVVIRQGELSVTLQGVASYERGSAEGSGNLLRLRLDNLANEGNPHIILAEETWEGRIIPDFEHGCDYCFIASDAQAIAPGRIDQTADYWATTALGGVANSAATDRQA